MQQPEPNKHMLSVCSTTNLRVATCFKHVDPEAPCRTIASTRSPTVQNHPTSPVVCPWDLAHLPAEVPVPHPALRPATTRNSTRRGLTISRNCRAPIGLSGSTSKHLYQIAAADVLAALMHTPTSTQPHAQTRRRTRCPTTPTHPLARRKKYAAGVPPTLIYIYIYSQTHRL